MTRPWRSTCFPHATPARYRLRRCNSLRACLVGCLLLIALSGCQTPYWAAGSDTRPCPTLLDRHPSQVLAPDALAMNIEAREGRSVQWYESRNDNRRSTIAGVQSPVYEREVTYIIDRQIQSGRFVRDYYNSTTYRQRFSETVR